MDQYSCLHNNAYSAELRHNLMLENQYLKDFSAISVYIYGENK